MDSLLPLGSSSSSFHPLFHLNTFTPTSVSLPFLQTTRKVAGVSKQHGFCCLKNGGLGMALLSVTTANENKLITAGTPFLPTLFSNPVFISAISALLAAQSSKLFLKFFEERIWDFKLMFDSGGMPSSHSALCTALTTSVALCHGVVDSLFPISLVFSLIVMYDAVGVRRHAGWQAQVINMLLDELFGELPVIEERLEEEVGHTLPQVFAGALLGCIVAILCFVLLCVS